MQEISWKRDRVQRQSTIEIEDNGTTSFVAAAAGDDDSMGDDNEVPQSLCLL